MQSTRGSTRLLLVGVLSAAAILLAATIAVLWDGGGGDADPECDDTARFVPDGSTRSGRERVDPDDDEDDDEDIYDDWGTGGRVEGERERWGDEFTVTPETLRHVLGDRHWEEIRRQIDILQRNGGEVPRDVVDALLALLEGDDTRIDAVLALGGVKSDEAGQLLAQRAADASWPLDVRNAALDAIAANGSTAALSFVQGLLAQADADPALLRHAFPALAAIGGPEAARSLLETLQGHGRDELTGALITALGKTDRAGDVLAQALRTARDGGDADLAGLVLKVGHLHGQSADPALRTEVRRMVEDATALEGIERADRRLALRVSAMAAASSMGGDLLDPVVRLARDDADGLRAAALHSLRQARGDAAAEKIAALLEAPGTEDHTREVLEALGETRSTSATRALVEHLNDESDNVRHAAARGLGLVRDPASVKSILARLDSATDDFILRRSLVEALGTIGANEALPTLEEIAASDDQAAQWARRAIGRIKSGNPDSTRMEAVIRPADGE